MEELQPIFPVWADDLVLSAVTLYLAAAMAHRWRNPQLAITAAPATKSAETTLVSEEREVPAGASVQLRQLNQSEMTLLS